MPQHVADMKKRIRATPYGRRSNIRVKLVWAALIMALGGGYGVLAPIMDDYRSGLRVMEPGCRIEHVIDGDTVDLGCGATRLRARVIGYDAPELFSPACASERIAGEAARRSLARAAEASERLEVAFLGEDKYMRALVDMRLDGVRVAAFMVEAGHGRRYLGGLRGSWCG